MFRPNSSFMKSILHQRHLHSCVLRRWPPPHHAFESLSPNAVLGSHKHHGTIPVLCLQTLRSGPTAQIWKQSQGERRETGAALVCNNVLGGADRRGLQVPPRPVRAGCCSSLIPSNRQNQSLGNRRTIPDTTTRYFSQPFERTKILKHHLVPKTMSDQPRRCIRCGSVSHDVSCCNERR